MALLSKIAATATFTHITILLQVWLSTNNAALLLPRLICYLECFTLIEPRRLAHGDRLLSGSFSDHGASSASSAPLQRQMAPPLLLPVITTTSTTSTTTCSDTMMPLRPQLTSAATACPTTTTSFSLLRAIESFWATHTNALHTKIKKVIFFVILNANLYPEDFLFI